MCRRFDPGPHHKIETRNQPMLISGFFCLEIWGLGSLCRCCCQMKAIQVLPAMWSFAQRPLPSLEVIEIEDNDPLLEQRL
jgi:hypothetical protein